MVTILLQKIIELLTGFFDGFIEWANTVGDKIASIKDNTDSLPDIKDNTDSINADTSSIKSMTSIITTNTNLIQSKVNTIKDTTNVISNNVGSIATSSGTTAAFAEDIANNTLNTYDKVTTIASDTTQLRADNQVVQADLDKIYDAIRWSLINVPMTETESGESPLIFNTDMAEKLNYIKCLIEAVETGSGTKSPSNPYTISSISDLDLTVNGVQTTIALGQTVYGGEIVLTKKASGGYSVKLRVTHGRVDLGSLTWSYRVSNSIFTTSVSDLYGYVSGSDYADLNCEIYDDVPPLGISATTLPNLTLCQRKSEGSTTIMLNDTNYTDTELLTQAVTGKYLIYSLATPIEIDLTDASDIVALVGVNTITSNGNGDITVTYTESVKHYLDKQEA